MRIAHITDFHLRHHLPGPARKPNGRLMPELVPKAVQDINGQSIDLVIITGDLLDYQYHPTIGPETPAQGLKDMKLLAGILKHIGSPKVIIPGNHDLESLVYEVFGPFPEEQTYLGFRIVCFRDSYVPGDFPGRVERERKRLLEVLVDADSPPQIHVRHCVVWPKYLEEDGPVRYEKAKRRMEMIAGSGLVRLVLSGHRHRGFPPSRVGNTYFVTAPAFCEYPHSYWIHELNDDDDLCIRVRTIGGPNSVDGSVRS